MFMIFYSYIKWKAKSYDWRNSTPILTTFSENTACRKLGMQQNAVTGEVSYDRGISAGWSWPSGNVLYMNWCLCYLKQERKSAESKSLYEKESLKARQTASSHKWIATTEFYFIFIILQYVEHMFLQLGWFSVCMNKSNTLSPCQYWARVDYTILTDFATTTAQNPATTFINWRS